MGFQVIIIIIIIIIKEKFLQCCGGERCTKQILTTLG